MIFTPTTLRTTGIAGWRRALWATIAALLLLPAVAMLFTAEVAWDAADFAAAALLLVGGGTAFEIGSRFVRHPRQRAAIGGVILLIVMLIWADAAVGVF